MKPNLIYIRLYHETYSTFERIMFVRLLFYCLFGTFGKLIIFCIQKRYFLTNFEFYFFQIDMNPSFFAIMQNAYFTNYSTEIIRVGLRNFSSPFLFHRHLFNRFPSF